MGGGINLATRYLKQVDERFSKESQAALVLTNSYKFTGDKTVKIYSIPIALMNDYTRSGSSRYGTPDDLARNVQTMTVNRDRAWTFIIDKGDKIQSEMLTDAGKALARQLRQVVIPEYDAYVFGKLAQAAEERGNVDTTAATKENAYSLFLQGQEFLGNHMVPDKGRVALCSYKFANLLMQDQSFMRYGDSSQEMLAKGVIGEVDGTKIVKVNSGRLPAGAACILTHPLAATAPQQLNDYKIHDNPPGISGWLCEGRIIYDCFVLNEKANAVYYIGGQNVLKTLDVMTAPGDTAGGTRILVNGEVSAEGNRFQYKLGVERTTVTAGSTVAGFTDLTNGGEVSADDNTLLEVVELDADNKVVSYGNAIVYKR